MNFDLAFERLINVERGMSLDPEDTGNWSGGRKGAGALKGTNFGISAAAYPELDIAGLTLEKAKAIYVRDYWRADLPPALGFQFFDAAVNHGPAAASRMLQRALGVKDDGVMGSLTCKAISAAEPLGLGLCFMAERLEAWTAARSWPAHGKGWTRRGAANLRHFATDIKG